MITGNNNQQEDIKFMMRALEVAEGGNGFVNPNPLVGAVIVKNGVVIGEGYHEYFGGPHAEINAIKNATQSVEGSTIYVTLEPCSYFGKTPPCAQALIENKARRVVIAMQDPNHLVAGKGITMLRNHGIIVESGLLEAEAHLLNEVYIKYITTHLPFVILKTAMSLDGKIATHTGDSKWISNRKSRGIVHHLRHKHMGIMVGVETVIKDNPTLSCRIESKQVSNPIRIITDSKLRIPENSTVLNINKARTIIATTNKANKNKVQRLKSYGVEITITKEKNGQVDLPELMKELGMKGIDSILMEGGGTLNFSALEAGIVDKVVSFLAPKIIGGQEAKTPIEGNGVNLVNQAIVLENLSYKLVENDLMITGYIKK